MPKATEMVNLRIEETSGVDRPAHLHDGWMVVKSASDADIIKAATDAGREATTNPREGEMPKAFDPSALDDVAKAAFEELARERDEAIEKAEAAEAAVAEKAEKAAEESDEIAKALADLPEAVRKSVESVIAKEREQIDEMRKSAERATAMAEAERDARLRTEAITKAREDFSHLPGGADAVGDLLFRLEKAESALGETMRKAVAPERPISEEIRDVLKQANGQLESGELFKELGEGESADTKSNAEEQLEKAAKSLREKDPSLTFEQAYAKAMDLDPQLARAAIMGEEA